MRSIIPVILFGLGVIPAWGQISEVPSLFPERERSSDVEEMPPDELVKLIGSPSVFIFDCNEEYMYSESHVPGAVLIEYDMVTNERLPADKASTLVFYCYNPECPAGHTAAQSAKQLGYLRSYYMREGIVGWEDAGMPTEP